MKYDRRIFLGASLAACAVPIVGALVVGSVTVPPLAAVPAPSTPAAQSSVNAAPPPEATPGTPLEPTPEATPEPAPIAETSKATAKPSTTPSKRAGASAKPSGTTKPSSAASKATATGPARATAGPATKAMRYVTSITPVAGGVPIRDGWNGTRVYLIRKFFGTDAPTSKGGTYDAATKAKVVEFQQQRGLPATGIVDRATWDAMDTGHPFDIDAYQVQPQVGLGAGAAERTDTMIEYALAQRGSRYTWGGAGPYNLGFDCSGLVLQAIYAAGYDPRPITVVKHAEPTYRTSQQLYAHSAFTSVPIAERRRGDLIFFGNKAGVVHHVAIYLGEGKMMEAYGPTAAIRSYSAQYGSSYVLPYAKRVFA